jgi:hypothetical protein
MNASSILFAGLVGTFAVIANAMLSYEPATFVEIMILVAIAHTLWCVLKIKQRLEND